MPPGPVTADAPAFRISSKPGSMRRAPGVHAGTLLSIDDAAAALGEIAVMRTRRMLLFDGRVSCSGIVGEEPIGIDARSYLLCGAGEMDGSMFMHGTKWLSLISRSAKEEVPLYADTGAGIYGIAPNTFSLEFTHCGGSYASVTFRRDPFTRIYLLD